jgi:hypothetical protein
VEVVSFNGGGKARSGDACSKHEQRNERGVDVLRQKSSEPWKYI